MFSTKYFQIWFCVLVFKLSTITLAYNLDTDNAIVFNIPQKLQSRQNSYFGYATALYTRGKNDSVVLIGAPRANASYSQSVLEPGTVYSCSIQKHRCEEWIIDESANGRCKDSATNYYFNQIRNNSWFGAVIETENKTDSSILVCAPRWIQADNIYWHLNGMCYWIGAAGIKSSDKTAVNPIFPFVNEKNKYIFYAGHTRFFLAHGQAGFSAHINSNKSDSAIALGGPGVFEWRGSSILLESLNQKIKSIIPNVKQKVIFKTSDYFGYSVTSGCYFKKGEYLFAAGAPRNFNGYIAVYDFPETSTKGLQIKAVKKGEQYGEYFGASLASCDVNSDGKDDLIVGAPFWSKDVNEGRVYVLFASPNKWTQDFATQTIEGKISGGRFGSTVTCLGDIDYDGYNDIIIGAPYEKDSGAIYLYNGNKNGISNKYSQKIFGSQFLPNIRGFGISISKPRDVNGDQYPDIAIGAYLSEQVVLLTSKPVISITVDLKHNIKKLYRDTKPFLINICTTYNGAYSPKKLDIVQILEIDALYGRAVSSTIKSNNSTYILPATLNIAAYECNTFAIRLNDNIQNIIDPISISVTVDLNYNVQVKDNNSTNNISHMPAVINKLNSKITDSIELPFVIECGNDNICHSDLQIVVSQTNLKFNNTYIIGSTSNLKLKIDVHNKGEPAYRSQVHIFIPEPFLLASIPSTCMESPWINNTLEVACNVGNPLLINETVTIELDTSKVTFDVKYLDLHINVSTQSEEKNPLDNSYSMRVNFDIDIDVAIAGKAQENLYSYFQKDKEDEKYSQNIRFQHIYEVQTFGASPINEATLIVEIPTHWKSNTYDMELIGIEQIIAHKDGHLLQCSNSSYSHTFETPTMEIIGELDITHKSARSLLDTMKEMTPINVPPANRTLFINCTNPMITCVQLECVLNSFTSSSVVKLTLKLDLKISNVLLLTLGSKDIIYFASRGDVNIIHPSNITQGSTNKPDTTIITTTFLGAPVAERVAAWILAVSIFLGILLLILFILILLKIGFFNRKKKEKLKALKAIESLQNEKNRPNLKTSSSEIDANLE